MSERTLFRLTFYRALRGRGTPRALAVAYTTRMMYVVYGVPS